MLFSVEKDGIDITQFNTYQNNDNTTFWGFSVDLPLNIGGGTIIESEGDWKMNITGAHGDKYQASAVVDDHILNYEATLADDKVGLDEPLELLVNLNYGNSPISDSVTVNATIFVPGEDMGTLLSNTPTPDGGSSEEGAPIGETKYNLLMQNPAFVAQLAASPNTKTLTNNGDGAYSTSFTNTAVTGYYKILVTIDGEKSNLGKFHRMELLTPMVVFEEIDPLSSDIRIILTGDATNPLGLLIKPASSNGLLLGPLYGDKINVSSSIGTVGNYIDNVDGSYVFPLLGVAKGETPIIKITFDDDTEPVFEGEVDENGPVTEKPLEYYIIIIILIILLIIRNIAKKGAIVKIPKWLLIILLLFAFGFLLLALFGGIYFF